MVDPGEKVSLTVRREFMEEAMDSTSASEEERSKLEEQVKAFFDGSGREMYSGYVDDPRNTDNAWMETVAFLFHDDKGDTVGGMELKAGDDAKALKWMEVRLLLPIKSVVTLKLLIWNKVPECCQDSE